MLTLVAFVAFAALTPAQEAAVDTGATLQKVDALRARGAYDQAAAELRGWIERWNAGSIYEGSFLEQANRMRALMKKMVEMEELLARAPDDPKAARAYLRHVVTPTEPTARTAEQARAIQLLALHDEEVATRLNATFPARIVVEVDADELEDPNLVAFPFESALIEASRDHLPIVRGAGASEIRVRITMRTNDTSRSGLFAGTSMKSYAIHMTAEVVAPDGESLLKAATTTAILGINPGNASKAGIHRCAQAIYQQLVDEVAKRAAL